MDEVRAAAEPALDRRLEAGAERPIALALSGGGDSIALLRLAAPWCARHGRRLLALTVDHGLNPDSASWTAFAGEAARAAGAGWRALAWTGGKPAAGLPAAARAARHCLLAEAAREAGARVILTGHTLDDALEGAVMRAADAPTLGSLREWSPSPAWPEGRGVFLLRPLLGLRREALRAWLRREGADWLDDPANDDPRFARTRARRRLAPSPPGQKVSAEGSDDGALPPDGAMYGGAALSAVGSADTFSMGEGWTADGRIVLPRNGAGGRVLAAALLCAAGTARPPRGEALERLLERLSGGVDVDATLAGARIVAAGPSVGIGRDAGERFRNGLAPLPLPAGEPVVWDGRFELTADAPGWTVIPLGGAISRLDPRDRRALKAVPAWARGAMPALLGASGEVRLPRPFAAGPALATSLAGDRFAAACGHMAREREIGVTTHGAERASLLC